MRLVFFCGQIFVLIWTLDKKTSGWHDGFNLEELFGMGFAVNWAELDGFRGKN
jgi:hypothetical protein